MKRFADLAVGESFYPLTRDGKMDLRWQLMKVSPIRITGPPPWESIKTTQNVITQDGLFNSVVVRSIDGKTNGFYDFIPDDTSIYIEYSL